MIYFWKEKKPGTMLQVQVIWNINRSGSGNPTVISTVKNREFDSLFYTVEFFGLQIFL